MFSSTNVKIRKFTAIVLVILSVCVMLTAQAETAAVSNIFGEVKEGTYVNAFFGLGCTLDGWVFYSDEAIEENFNHKPKDVLLSELDEMGSQPVAVMAATSTNSMQTATVVVCNVKDRVDQINEAGMEQFVADDIAASFGTLEEQGITDVQLRVEKVSIGDKSYIGAAGEYKYMGVQMYTKQLYDITDGYLIIAAATTGLTDTTDEVLGYFFLQ